MTIKKSNEGLRKGLNSQHVGLVIDNRLIAPPSQFALAYIGTQSQKKLSKSLDGVISGIKKGNYDLNETPMLSHYVLNHAEFSLEDFQAWAQAKNGTQKIIDWNALSPLESKISVSIREQFSTSIESRRSRKVQRPYDIHVYNPFEMENWEFLGSTEFSAVSQKRGSHWATGLPQDKKFLSGLNFHNRREHTRQINVIDYAQACAIIGLHELVKSGKKNQVTGSGKQFLRDVPLPFDFSNDGENYNATRFAFETFLQKYATPKVIKEAMKCEDGGLTLDEIDMNLLGKKGFVTHYANQLIKHGRASKGTILKSQGRHLPDGAWAIMQAYEEHMFDKKRHFKGYSLEFVDDSNFRTTSIVYDLARNYSTDGHWSRGRNKDLSVRIVYDDNFELPYIMYKNFDDLATAKSRQLGNRNLMNMVNFSKDVKLSYKNNNGENDDVRRWKDTDWKTGKTAECSIWEPNDSVLRRASQLSRNGGKYISASEFKNKYYQAWKKRR